MKSAVENLSPTRVKMHIEVPFAELKPAIDAAYKEIASQIQVPGFRKGKVPSRLVDQRVGRGYVIETAINNSLDNFYRDAVNEASVVPLARPEVEVQQAPGIDEAALDSDLVFDIEVDVRPEIELPEYSGLEVEVEAREAGDAEVEKALEELRGRFGTLKAVERPAADGDYTTIDLVATIDGETIDEATGLSYLIGSGSMLEGLDEALTGLSADEDATFETTLAGGEHAGEKAQVKVVLTAVKERELPEADDDFAQLASEFDTIAELRESLVAKAAEDVLVEQGIEARDKVLEVLVGLVEVPVPASVLDEQVEQHFSGANQADDHDTDEHRAEIKANTEKAFRNEIVLDAVAEKEEIEVEQGELIEYLIQSAQQYGMDPNQFAQMLDGAGQVPMMIGEVRRRKALAKVLELAKVKDSNGKAVDLEAFVKPAGEDAPEAE
ncbi:trigger factor [Galactobacter valiniphilus]|uniref:Trigger factor n=1 Tax=Galactobacter valiniphilus TaxID=2676122 RepID=A0A399J7H3_9MICC|nr:trigger factor [Galactobacter valiniphilus]RII41254.1 trigger factor [Galactobacter valiniphilus]